MGYGIFQRIDIKKGFYLYKADWLLGPEYERPCDLTGINGPLELTLLVGLAVLKKI